LCLHFVAARRLENLGGRCDLFFFSQSCHVPFFTQHSCRPPAAVRGQEDAFPACIRLSGAVPSRLAPACLRLLRARRGQFWTREAHITLDRNLVETKSCPSLLGGSGRVRLSGAVPSRLACSCRAACCALSCRGFSKVGRNRRKIWPRWGGIITDRHLVGCKQRPSVGGSSEFGETHANACEPPARRLCRPLS